MVVVTAIRMAAMETVRVDTITVTVTVRAAIITVKAADLPAHRLVRATRTANVTEIVRVEETSRTVMVRVVSETARAVETSRIAAVRAALTAVQDQASVVVQAAASAWAVVPVLQYLQ